MEQPKESAIRTTIRTAGGSNEITIPKDLIDYLRWGEGDEIHIEAKEKKYGRCITLWCYKKQAEEYNKQKCSTTDQTKQ